MNKLENLKSWLLTFISDFLFEIITGFGVLIETGDFTKAAFMAMGLASLRTAFRISLKRLKQIKNTR